MTKVPFQRPDDFDLQQHLAKSFGVYHGDGDVKIMVRFAPVVAEFQVSDTEENKRWIMSFGQHAVVQEPESLRREIFRELNSLLAAHGEESGRTPRRRRGVEQ